MKDSPLYKAPHKSYVVCSNPRSGSTYLVLLLASTGVLGFPWEWLRGDGGLAHHDFETYTTDAQEQVEAVLREGQTPNGICSLKMFPEHFDTRTESNWAKRLPALHYVYLTREDILGQAISLAIARQTHSYASWTARYHDPIYSTEQIRRCLNFLATGEARWRMFFAMNGISPLKLVYEKMVQVPQETVNAVAELVGLTSTPIDWRNLNVTVQRDGVNSEWRERFMAENGNTATLPALTSAGVYDTLYGE